MSVKYQVFLTCLASNHLIISGVPGSSSLVSSPCFDDFIVHRIFLIRLGLSKPAAGSAVSIKARYLLCFVNFNESSGRSTKQRSLRHWDKATYFRKSEHWEDWYGEGWSLRDDNSFLNTGTTGALSQGRPEVGVDGVAGGVGAVEPDVEVGLVVPCLVLDTVGGQLRLIH